MRRLARMGRTSSVIVYEADQARFGGPERHGGNTVGNWTAGVTHPIVNENPITLNMSIWRPFGYPRVNVVRPSDREIVLTLGTCRLSKPKPTPSTLPTSTGLSWAKSPCRVDGCDGLQLRLRGGRRRRLLRFWVLRLHVPARHQLRRFSHQGRWVVCLSRVHQRNCCELPALRQHRRRILRLRVCGDLPCRHQRGRCRCGLGSAGLPRFLWPDLRLSCRNSEEILFTRAPEFSTGVRVCRWHVIILGEQVTAELQPTKL